MDNNHRLLFVVILVAFSAGLLLLYNGKTASVTTVHHFARSWSTQIINYALPGDTADTGSSNCHTSCRNDDPLANITRRKNQTHHILVANVSIYCAVCLFNNELDEIRLIELGRKHIFDNLTQPAKGTAKAVGSPAWGGPLYFRTVVKFPQVTNVMLWWPPLKEKRWDIANLPVKTYYPSVFPPQGICKQDTQTEYCRNPAALLNSSKDLPFIAYGVNSVGDKKGRLMTPVPGYPEAPLYMQMVHNAYADSIGNIHTGGLDLIPTMCQSKSVNRNIRSKAVHYDEVFIISQFWGYAFFHSMVETLPRIAAYIDFLKRNPSIRIHIAAKHLKYHIKLFGLDESRVIMSNIHANIIYAPQGGGCGQITDIAGQLLYDKFQSLIPTVVPSVQKDSLPQTSVKETGIATNTPVPSPWGNTGHYIVVIKRSHERWLDSHDKVVSLLTKIASETHGRVTVKVFGDRPVPPIETTLDVFSGASVVLAPHGAGLANTIYCPTGTAIIEVLCNPDYNGCYWNMASKLGHQYFGLRSIIPRACGPLYVDLSYLDNLVRRILKAKLLL